MGLWQSVVSGEWFVITLVSGNTKRQNGDTRGHMDQGWERDSDGQIPPLLTSGAYQLSTRQLLSVMSQINREFLQPMSRPNCG